MVQIERVLDAEAAEGRASTGTPSRNFTHVGSALSNADNVGLHVELCGVKVEELAQQLAKRARVDGFSLLETPPATQSFVVPVLRLNRRVPT